MISNLVILGSLALGALFTAAWLLRPALRRQIERPKHWFADQAQQYDRACHAAALRIDVSSDGE